MHPDDVHRARDAGADAIKALALGATAVGLGGEKGVTHVLRSILAETDPIMAVDGYPTLASLNRQALRRIG